MPSAIARTAEREDLGFTRTCRVAPAGWSKMMSGDKASGSLVEGVMGRGNMMCSTMTPEPAAQQRKFAARALARPGL